LAFSGFDVIDSKPNSSTYPKSIQTLGDHLRAARIEKELLQADVARYIQVSEATITNWENNLTKPETRYIPAIIRFLGYNPFPTNVKVFGARVKYCRQTNGLTHKEMGKILGVNASTVGSWEKQDHMPQRSHLNQIEKKLCKLIG